MSHPCRCTGCTLSPGAGPGSRRPSRPPVDWNCRRRTGSLPAPGRRCRGPGLPDALPVGVSPPTQAARLNSRAPAQNTGTRFFIVSSFSTMALGLSLRSGVIGAIIATSASAVKEFSPTFTLWSRNLYRPVKKARSLTGGIFYQMDEFGKRGEAVPVLLLWRGRTGALFCQAGAGGIS